MTLIRSIIRAFSMFSTIKMPYIDWSERSMRYTLAAFPLIGVVIALLLGVWFFLASLLQIDRLIMALVTMIIPLVITGGIHIDGFADTVDALSSHASQEKKRAILKDSNIGAFAGIGISAYLICYFAIAAQLKYTGYDWIYTTMLVCLIPVWVRIMSGIVSILYPGSSTEGLLNTFRGSANKKGALIILFILLAAAIAYAYVFLGWFAATLFVGVTLIISLYLYVMSKRQFGGMSGDLSGFYLQILEITLIAVVALVEAIGL